MRFSIVSVLTVALAADATVASSWFGKTVYNKWHETELERWLADNNIPYPAPADRKDLENLVKSNWNDNVAHPYKKWDAPQISSYLTSKGQQVKKGSEKNADSLAAQVKGYWYETDDQANTAYGSVRDWIFDSWTDSQLKSFCDKHGVPVPQPRARDSLLKSARENYQTAANKLGQTYAYPGNWLYESWSESELKAWLDERGLPAPQPSSRDKLIASVRRNSRLASLRMADASSSAAASAAAATQSISNMVFDSWTDSQLKEWADKNNVKVPQGSKRNELVALARKHRAKLMGDSASAQAETVASSASSYVGAATSSAGNQYAQATDDAALKAQQGSNGFWYYVNAVKQQLGLAASSASASVTSATGSASKSATSLSGAASKSASSASSLASVSSKSLASAASKSASSASASAGKSGQKIVDAATESATKGSNRAGEAYQKATDHVKEEL